MSTKLVDCRTVDHTYDDRLVVAVYKVTHHTLNAWLYYLVIYH